MDPCLLHAREVLWHYLVLSLGEVQCQAFLSPRFRLVLAKDESHPSWEEKLTKEGSFASWKEGDITVFFAMKGRGIDNAVICYCEESLGISFYTAEEENVPSVKSLPSYPEGVKNPLFSFRNYLTGDTYQMVVDESHPATKQDFMMKAKAVDAFTPFDEIHGGAMPFYARGLFHNFHLYCPYEVYGKTHPEFFAPITVLGKNIMTIDLTNGIDEKGNLLETNEDTVAKVVLRELKKDVLSHPDAVYFSLTQEDGDRYFDDAHNQEEEKKYKRSGILIRFCNAVIRPLHRWAKEELGRDIKLVTFAYSYTEEAPVKEENGKYLPLDSSVVADPNLYLMLACAGNGAYSYFSPKQDYKIHTMFDSWSVIAKHFWFWAYDADFANYCSFFDSFLTIRENVLGFAAHHIDYLLINGSYDECHNWQANLRAYLYRRLMWDPSLDPKELQEDYLLHYYGPAAFVVQEIMDIYHQNYQAKALEGHDIYFGTWGTQVHPENIPLDVVEASLAAWEKGEKAIQNASLSPIDKQKYHTRLMAVKVTPLNYLYLNFASYFPNQNEGQRAMIRNRFLEAAKEGQVSFAREYFSFDRYVDFVESEDYKVHPKRIKDHLYVEGRKQ